MIASADVSHALEAQGRRLAFSPLLERRFEIDTGAERCRRLVRQNYIGLAIYQAFMAGDWLLIHDVFAISVILHMAVMTPIMLGVNRIIARRPTVLLREGILAGGIVLATLAILVLMFISRSPLRTSEHHSVVLVILFATMVQRIRFPYVVAACVASFAVYVVALAPFSGDGLPRVLVAEAVLAGVILFSLIGCYNLEHEQRVSYLLGLRDRLRNAELEEISRCDPLTGVGNRRALDAAFSRAPRDDEHIAALLCDIDFFKDFNDMNGHLAGDRCLVEVARLIEENVRERLDVYRFGGEEFLATIEFVQPDEALAIAERIRAAVEAAGIKRRPDGPDVVTVSIGVALASSPTALRDLIAQADAALYEAKRGGRNTVRLYRPTMDGAQARAA